MTTESFDARIAALVAGRYGAFTFAEAIGLGASKGHIKRRLADGRWDRLFRGVYRVATVPRSWRQTLMAAVLAAGEGSVASHTSAAVLWRIWRDREGPHITVPDSRRIRIPGIVVHRMADLTRDHVTVVDGIPVTTPPRTIIDLAASEPREKVGHALDEAYRLRVLTIPWLAWCVEELRRSGRPGVGVVESLIAERADAGAPTESELEDMLVDLIRRHGLPKPVRQFKVWRNGRLLAKPDFAYPELRIVIEMDGYLIHTDRRQWELDRMRDNAMQLAGWLPLRFTWRRIVDDPAGVAAEIVAAIDTQMAAMGRRPSRRDAL